MFPETIFEPVPTSDEITRLVDELRSLSERETEDCRDCGGFHAEDRKTCEQAIHALVGLSRAKVVTGSIQGGVLTLEDVPEGVGVDIKDYDVDGVDEDRLEESDRGRYFQAGG
ncbi:MAG: hypothetical protein ACXAC5_02130 [Promethearchaeota archaeon]